MRRWFHRIVLSRRWLTFIVMGLAFLGFGSGTLNLIYVAQANLALLLDNGWQAVMDGGGQQLVEVLFTGYFSMAAYLVFKTCEYSLVHWMGEAPPVSSLTNASAAGPAIAPPTPSPDSQDHEDRPVAR